jgi:hypothetical protein
MINQRKMISHSLSIFTQFQVDMFCQRYALIQQRILRQDIFQPKLVVTTARSSSGGGTGATHTLTPVESLLGRGGVRYLLGMIVQVRK